MSDIAPQTADNVDTAVSAGPNSVTIEQRGGGWFVRVVDEGRVFENVFHLEAHAASYADGQRMRLGLFR